MKIIFLTMTFVISASFSVLANAIPYPDVGTIAPTVAITAATTGDIDGFFYGKSAADVDEIQMCDITLFFCSADELDNQTTAVGTEVDFGSVIAGDVLVFNLINFTAGYVVSSDPSFSVDVINHAYVTSYDGTGGPAGIPAGTFIGMEDIRVPGSDLDYNDDQFVVTNLLTSPVPEPALLLLCLGVVGLIPVARRKFGF